MWVIIQSYFRFVILENLWAQSKCSLHIETHKILLFKQCRFNTNPLRWNISRKLRFLIFPQTAAVETQPHQDEHEIMHVKKVFSN